MPERSNKGQPGKSLMAENYCKQFNTIVAKTDRRQIDNLFNCLKGVMESATILLLTEVVFLQMIKHLIHCR